MRRTNILLEITNIIKKIEISIVGETREHGILLGVSCIYLVEQVIFKLEFKDR